MTQDFLIVLILGVYFISCSEKRTTLVPSPANSVAISLDIPDTSVSKAELFYDTKKSRWTLNDQLYSGYAVSFYQDSTLREKFGILKGRKQNRAIHFYPDGRYKVVANYYNGKLNGDKKTWSSDRSHVLLSHLKYTNGKLNGEQNKWYSTGELFKKLNFNMGKEEGLQQAFRKNGALFANYEAREGRIFGLKKATLCYGLEDERIQTRKE